MIERFIREEDGMGTVELLLILAGLVSVALIFKRQLTEFMSDAKTKVFGKAKTDGLTITDQ